MTKWIFVEGEQLYCVDTIKKVHIYDESDIYMEDTTGEEYCLDRCKDLETASAQMMRIANFLTDGIESNVLYITEHKEE